MQSTIDRDVAARLLESGVRYTGGRQAVVAALADADGPMSAAELHGTIDQLPLSSIYRTLTVLEEAGVLAPHHGTRGITRYELAEWLGGHHHHLVCIDCGSVEDVEVASGHEARLEIVVTEISEEATFVPINHALEIEGRCVKCA